MKNTIKKVGIKTRDKFLHSVTDQLNDLYAKVGALDKEIEAKNNDLTTRQKSIEEVLEKHAQRSVNSGTLYLSDNEMVTKLFSGLKLYLDPSDISLAPHIALDYIWESNITSAWLTLLKPADTVLDIGANFGYYGALAGQYTDKKSARVIMFEANPELIPYIDKTLSLNWLHEQCKVENLAVSNEDGTVQLNVLKDYIGSSSIHSTEDLDKYMHNKMHVETAKLISVPATTIDSYCKKNDIKQVDLIKMDIEGYEDKAYQGMRKIIQDSPNATMFIEFTKDGYQNPKEFYEQMLSDFGNVYVIYENHIIKPKKSDYESIAGSFDDWVMPIFSKRKDLEQPIKGL